MILNESWKGKTNTFMLSEDDKRFYELYCKQAIHQKRKNVVAKMPERVYDNRDKKPIENIEMKYEVALSAMEEDRLLNKIFEKHPK
jgi:hypothetical protein